MKPMDKSAAHVMIESNGNRRAGQQLGAALTRFIDQSNRILAANREDVAGIHADVAEIRANNARTDRQLLEMQRRAEKN